MNNPSDFEISLLGFLSQQSMHGYDLYKHVTDLSGFGIVWKIKIGKLYAMLKKLEDEGLIVSSLKQEGNRPPKKILSLTTSGKLILQSWLKTPVNHGRDFRILFLLKLYFLMQNGAINARELITFQTEVCRRWLSERKSFKNNDNEINKISNHDFPRIVNQYRQIQIQGYLDWLDWCKSYFS